MDLIANNSIVSIISPCYNSEEYVGRMLDSILSQTYKKIEMICVDDGSSDKTKDVINAYKSDFESSGMSLIYLRQEHRGQSFAVNAGLKVVTGEFLSWVDSDDFLYPNSVEKKISVLVNIPNIGIVTADFNIVDENNVHNVIGRGATRLGLLNYQPNQFYLALAGMSIIESGCHLVRTSHFESIFLDRQIADCIEGQNFQLMLPLYYKLKRAYINEPLSCYVIRGNSHYHRLRTESALDTRNKRLTEMLISVLVDLEMQDGEIRKCLGLSCFL
jgi:glycosyltransferase involved in cell wall biosynthesis